LRDRTSGAKKKNTPDSGQKQVKIFSMYGIFQIFRGRVMAARGRAGDGAEALFFLSRRMYFPSCMPGLTDQSLGD